MRVFCARYAAWGTCGQTNLSPAALNGVITGDQRQDMNIILITHNTYYIYILYFFFVTAAVEKFIIDTRPEHVETCLAAAEGRVRRPVTLSGDLPRRNQRNIVRKNKTAGDFFTIIVIINVTNAARTLTFHATPVENTLTRATRVHARAHTHTHTYMCYCFNVHRAPSPPAISTTCIVHKKRGRYWYFTIIVYVQYRV